MAAARTNKKLKSVDVSELCVSTRGDIFLIEDEAEWLLGSRDTGRGLGHGWLVQWAGFWLARSTQYRREVGAGIH